MAASRSAPVSVIVPVLNEARALRAGSSRLDAIRHAGCELVVVDGESGDGSRAVAAELADRVVTAPPGRARQMNAGARAARGRLLLFLHADTVLPPRGLEALLELSETTAQTWGRFDVRLSGDHPAFRVIERAMNLRSRVTGIATGDQAIFVSRELFDAAGGYPEIDLMEDIALCTSLRRRCRPRCLRLTVTTSSRRWERDGILRTVVLMWRLRLAYALGVNPTALARRYHGA